MSVNQPAEHGPLRVLHVWEPSIGGVDLHARSLVTDQRRRGLDARALAPTAADLGTGHFGWSVGRSPFGVMGATRRLSDMLKEFDPEVVHLHSSVAGILGRAVVRGRRPTIFTPHAWSFFVGGPFAPALRMIERLLMRWTTVVVAVGESERAIATRLGASTVVSIANGIDLDRFVPPTSQSRRAARLELDLPADSQVVLCVGRIARQKGQDLLLTAWPAVHDAHPDAILVLAGAESSSAVSGTLPASAGASVRRLGDVSDIVPVMHAADLIVQPSRWEGLSYATIEALAIGLPIVGSDIEAIKEVAADFARYVSVDDVQGFATAVSDQLRHQATTPPINIDQRHRAERLFDLRRQQDQIAAITDEVAGRQHPHPATLERRRRRRFRRC